MRRLEDESFKDILLNLIKERRSVRVFNGKKIPREDILSIIEAGIWAPTGCNNQELKFLILDEEEEIKKILEFKPSFKGVSTFVLVFCDMSLPMSRKIYFHKSGAHLPYIDTGLALANMILYAKSKGIDSCVFNLSPCHLKPTKKKGLLGRFVRRVKIRLNLYGRVEESFEFCLRNHLKIPHHLKIMCGVAFGFAEEYPDVAKDRHGGRRIMREEVSRYLIK